MFRLLKKVITLIMSASLTWGYCLLLKKSRMCCKKRNYWQ